MLDRKFKKQVNMGLVSLLTACSILTSNQVASENNLKTQRRLEVIEAVEDKLSSLYTFTKDSAHNVPHFEVLDVLYPEWHHGDPALARQFWVHAKYSAFLVQYRVDYVTMSGENIAEIKGKKLVYWTESDDPAGLEKLWPFQFWANLTNRLSRENTYLRSTYALRYSMTLSKSESNEWIVTSEVVHDNPHIVNNLRNHCLYKKQLEDWGLRNDCKEGRSLPIPI